MITFQNVLLQYTDLIVTRLVVNIVNTDYVTIQQAIA